MNKLPNLFSVLLYYRCFSMSICAFYVKICVYTLIIRCTCQHTFVLYAFRILLNVYHFRPFSEKIFHVIRYVQLSDISFKISGRRNTKSKDIIYININYVSSLKTEAFFYVCMSRTSILSRLGSYSILFLALSMWQIKMASHS